MALSGLSEAAKGHLAMLIFSALVAGSFSFGSMIANQIDPVALTAARFVVAGAVIGTAAAVGPGLRLSHFRAPWRYLILGAVFGTYFVLMFEGLKTAPPISTAAVFTLTPVLSGIFGWLLVRQTTTPRMGAALAVGALGALWVIFRADLSAVVTLDIGRGEAIYFVGCVAHAAYPALVRRFHRGEPVLAFTLGMMVAALGVLLAYGWPAIRATDWAALPAQVWLVMLYLALFASTVTFLLLQFAALRLPSAKVMAYTYLTPSWVICWEAVLGHGLPRGLILVGVALTMGALWLLLKDEEAMPA